MVGDHYARDRVTVMDVSGGSEVLVHPAITYSPGHNLLIFGIVSLPVWQDFRDVAVQTRYRVGTGVIYGW